MRNRERIGKFKELFKDSSNIREYGIWLLDNGLSNEVAIPDHEKLLNHIVTTVNEFDTEFWRKWKENSELRLTQLLITLMIIPNYKGCWFYLEDEDFLEYLKNKKK